MEITLQSSFASYGLRPSGNIRKPPPPPPKKKKMSPHCRLIEITHRQRLGSGSVLSHSE